MTPLVGNRGVIVSVHDVCVRNRRLPFLANLVHYQCDFSAIRENNRDLSITRGYPHVMLWERSVGWGGWLAHSDERYCRVLDHQMHDSV